MKRRKLNASFLHGSAAKRAAAFFLLLSILFAGVTFSLAEDQQGFLRVGFYAFSGYHNVAADGTRSGYGYDLLQLMARYANLSYQYHGYGKSLDENVDMLRNGEIDLITGIKRTPEFDEEFDFSERTVGQMSMILTVKAGNQKIVRGNYETYNGIRVGVLSGTTRGEELRMYAEEKGFSYTAVYFDSTAQMEQALHSGEVDALISTSFRGCSDEWLIDSFHESPIFVMMRRGDSATKALVDDALTRLELEETHWRTVTLEKNMHAYQSSTLFLTEEERAFLREQQEIGKKFRVLVNPDRYPYSYIEDGQLTGIMITLFDLIAQRAGIRYEWIMTSDREEYAHYMQAGNTDICVDLTPDYYLAESSGYAITDVYLTAPFSWIRRNDSSGNIELAAKLIYTQFTPAQYAYDSAYHELDYIVYPTTEECLRSVRSGETDGYCTYTYKAEQIVLEDASGLLVSNIALTENQFSIGVVHSLNRHLISILNKAVNSIADWERVDIIRHHTTIAAPSFSLLDLFRKNRQVTLMVYAVCSILGILTMYLVMQKQNQKHLKEKIRIQDLQISDSLRGMLDVLATAIEFRSSESGDHVRRIRGITSEVMTALSKKYPAKYGFNQTQIDQIATASVLHDVGKIAIPDHILNKPGKLTELEFKTIKQHPLKGCELLERLPNFGNEPLFAYAYDICRWHHERWDGKGYPDGLSGSDIPIWVQAAAIADVYDALTSPRVYKEAFSRETAVRMIRNGDCGCFNPEVVDAFLSVVNKIELPAAEPEGVFSRAPAGKDTATLLISAFQRLINETTDIIFLKDVDLVYRAVSPGFAKMVGCDSPEDVICLKDVDLFDDQIRAKRYVIDDKKLLTNGKDLIDYLEPIGEMDGIPHYGSTNKYLLTDSNGRIMGILGITRDVTNEYFTTRHYQKELRYLFTLPEDVYFAIYFDLNTWRINGQNTQTLSGVRFPQFESIAECANWSYENIIDRRGPACAFYGDFSRESLEQVYESGKNELVMEYLFRMPDGSPQWIRDEIRFLVDPTNGHLCVMIATIDIQKKKENEILMIQRAERDPLTGLLNRNSFSSIIQKTLEDKRSDHALHAVMIIDLDNFKKLNDTLGHIAGDEMLKKVGEVLRNSFRSSDLVARLGGDEFIAFMGYVTDREAVEEKAEAIIKALQMQAGNEKKVDITASVGVSLYPGDGITAEELYDRADKAMYRAKRLRKNCCYFYEDIENESGM